MIPLIFPKPVFLKLRRIGIFWSLGKTLLLTPNPRASNSIGLEWCPTITFPTSSQVMLV